MLVPEGETKEFLGREFLTWLWFRGERDAWNIDFSQTERVSYGMDELLTLEPDDPTSCSHKLSGPVPVNSPEAQIGLPEGKKVTAARLFLSYKDREWSVTVNDRFQFSSIKLVKPTTAEIEDRFVELSDDLENLAFLFDRIYSAFLTIRLSDNWQKQELPEIREWISQKQ